MAPETEHLNLNTDTGREDVIDIREDDISDPRVIQFLRDHMQHMIKVTPPGCVHALDVDSLRKPDITFWVVWENDQVVGCGALKRIDSHHAELKSMRTAPSLLRNGVASALLQHIIDAARFRKIQRLSLETGSYDAFKPARNLYSKFGFSYSGPFSDYTDSPNSVFMTLNLT